MERKSRGILVAVGVLTLVSVCSAGPINGTLALSGVDVSQNGANLLVSTQISSTDTVNLGPGTGDYSVIPNMTSFGPTTLNTTDLSAFTLSDATYGSFGDVTTADIQTQNADTLDVYLLGTFTPGPGLAAGLDPTSTSLEIDISQSGSALSEQITLSSPPAASGVPEPASVGLLGGGLVAILCLYRRKAANSN